MSDPKKDSQQRREMNKWLAKLDPTLKPTIAAVYKGMETVEKLGGPYVGALMDRAEDGLINATKNAVKTKEKEVAAEKKRIAHLKCIGGRKMTVTLAMTSFRKKQEYDGDILIMFSAEDGYTGSTKRMKGSGFYEERDVLLPPSGVVNVQAFPRGGGQKALATFSYTSLPEKTLVTLELREEEGDGIDVQVGQSQEVNSTTDSRVKTDYSHTDGEEGERSASIPGIWESRKHESNSDQHGVGTETGVTTGTVSGKQASRTVHQRQGSGIFVLRATNLKGATPG